MKLSYLQLLFVIILFVLVNFCFFQYISRPVPIPSFQSSISILILSYQRPHNLKHSLAYLKNIPFVKEIVIYHGKKEHYDDSCQHYKIRHVKDYEKNSEMFTLRRFYHIQDLKSEYVLLLDDDIYPKVDLLVKMLEICIENENICVGPFTRGCDALGYNTKGDGFLLTPILMASKKTFLEVWEKMKQNKRLYNLVIQQKGNCEDLFFQHEYRKLFKGSGEKVTGGYKNLDFLNGYSTTNWGEHYKLRNNFCKLISTEN